MVRGRYRIWVRASVCVRIRIRIVCLGPVGVLEGGQGLVEVGCCSQPEIRVGGSTCTAYDTLLN